MTSRQSEMGSLGLDFDQMETFFQYKYMYYKCGFYSPEFPHGLQSRVWLGLATQSRLIPSNSSLHFQPVFFAVSFTWLTSCSLIDENRSTLGGTFE